MAKQASSQQFDTSSWLSELDRATRESMGPPEPELSGQGLVVSGGGGALRAGQIVATSAIEAQNARLEMEGKESARYYALGLEAGIGGLASGLPQGIDKAAAELVERLEHQLGTGIPPGMSLGQMAELEQGLKKIQQGKGEDLDHTELVSIARVPAAMVKARSAGVPEEKLKKADKERRALIAAVSAAAMASRAERKKQEKERDEMEPEASEMLKRTREALPGWREGKEGVEAEALEALETPELPAPADGEAGLGDRLDAKRRPAGPAAPAGDSALGM